MTQSRGVETPEVIRITIDIGCSNIRAFLSENPGSDSVDYPLEFPSSGDDRRRTTTELDTTIVFSANGNDCVFGSDGWSLSGGHVIVDWKLGAMGLDPYASRLARACERLRQSAPHLGEINAATIYRRIFSHILDTAQRHLYRKHARTFDGIGCYLTHPVSCSESLKLLLYQEATAVGFNVMGGVSESLAAAHYIKSRKSHGLPFGARLIIDFGGATVDASVVYEDSVGRIMQACASHGFPGGGQMINEAARSWLKDQCCDWNALNHDTQWALNISPLFDRCKRSFTGLTDHDMYYGDGNIVTIPSDDMRSFFEPLISRGVKLVQDMCDRARLAGHPVSTIVVCGGVTGNRWFFEEFRQQQVSRTGIDICMQVPEPEIVASGALAYSRSPIVEEHVVAQGIGLSYIGDYTQSGRHLKRGVWQTGIGWILSEGQQPSKLPRKLIFTKDVEPRSEDKGDHWIETDVYATWADPGGERGQHIQQNNLIEWDCEITYPVTDSILSGLLHLGKISGALPHKEMFPLGTETQELEFEFQLTLEPYRNLFKSQFCVKLPNGTLCPLRDVRYIPLPLVPRSEFLNRRAPADQPLTNRSIREDIRPSYEQQNAIPSGSLLRVSRGSREPSIPPARRSPAIITRKISGPTKHTLHYTNGLRLSGSAPTRMRVEPVSRTRQAIPKLPSRTDKNIAKYLQDRRRQLHSARPTYPQATMS